MTAYGELTSSGAEGLPSKSAIVARRVWGPIAKGLAGVQVVLACPKVGDGKGLTIDLDLQGTGVHPVPRSL